MLAKVTRDSLSLRLTQVTFVAKTCHSLLTFSLLMCLLFYSLPFSSFSSTRYHTSFVIRSVLFSRRCRITLRSSERWATFAGLLWARLSPEYFPQSNIWIAPHNFICTSPSYLYYTSFFLLLCSCSFLCVFMHGSTLSDTPPKNKIPNPPTFPPPTVCLAV